MRCNCIPHVEFSKEGMEEHLRLAHGMTLEAYHAHFKQGGLLPGRTIEISEMPQANPMEETDASAKWKMNEAYLNVTLPITKTRPNCGECGCPWWLGEEGQHGNALGLLLQAAIRLRQEDDPHILDANQPLLERIQAFTSGHIRQLERA